MFGVQIARSRSDTDLAGLSERRSLGYATRISFAGRSEAARRRDEFPLLLE